MRIDIVLRYVGTVLLLLALFMFASALVSLFNNVDTAFFPLLISAIITSVIGYFARIFVSTPSKISGKEGYMIVIVSWVMCCIVGTMPYLIWGGEFSVLNALFESTSGFTSTGASILNDVEALPKGLMFWRFSTIWIGGIGIILFTLVILPSAGHTKLTLSSVELSTIAKDNFAYNTKKLIQVVTLVYVGLTIIQSVLLSLAGMEVFDSVCHSFSTIATGGFSTKNLGIMHYNSLWIEIILIVFMVIGGMHFGLIYATLKRKKNTIFNSEIIRFYITVIIVGSVLATVSLYANGTYDSVSEALRHGTFQVVSHNTTTGFASSDNAGWPPFATLILVYMSIQCATAGSTSGGIKADRVLLLYKSLKARVVKIQHPSSIYKIRLNGKVQDDDTVNGAILLILFFVTSVFVSTLFLSLWDMDLGKSFSVSIAALSNVGAGFHANLENMHEMPGLVKIWLSVMMLFGRLELFGLIRLFILRSWK